MNQNTPSNADWMSFGFLFGPLAGGLLVEWLRSDAGEPAWAAVFGVVGAGLVLLGLVSWRVLGALASAWRHGAAGTH